MLRINTPVRLYTIREKDLGDTELARLVWKRILKANIDVEVTPIVQELVACLTGKPFFRDCVLRDMALLFEGRVYDIREVLGLEQETYDTVVQCSNGTLTYPSRMLRDNFKLAEDFLDEYPSSPLVLPFTTDEVQRAVYPSEHAKLLSCYECICHLNPKSNLHYFYFNLKDIPLVVIHDLAKALTETERDGILAYASRKSCPGIVVPSRTGPLVLSIFNSVRYNADLLKSLFLLRHPSFLFCLLYRNINAHPTKTKYAVKALLTWDFTPDCDEPPVEDNVIVLCIQGVIRAVVGCGGTLQTLCAAYGAPVPSVLPYGVSIESVDAH